VVGFGETGIEGERTAIAGCGLIHPSPAREFIAEIDVPGRIASRRLPSHPRTETAATMLVLVAAAAGAAIVSTRIHWSVDRHRYRRALSGIFDRRGGGIAGPTRQTRIHCNHTETW